MNIVCSRDTRCATNSQGQNHSVTPMKINHANHPNSSTAHYSIALKIHMIVRLSVPEGHIVLNNQLPVTSRQTPRNFRH